MSRIIKIADRTRALSSWIEVFRNIWGLAALIGIVAFVVGRVAISRYGSWPAMAGAAALAGMAIVGFGLGWHVARKRLVTADYSWEAADYTYEFNPNDVLHHVQLSKIKIRANRNNVQLFRGRYWWTGVGKASLDVLSPHHKLLTELVRDAWRYYYVLLEQALSKGGVTTILLRHDLHDAERMFQPMITKDVTEAVPRLSLRIVFPPLLRPTRVLAAELARSKARGEDWEVIRENEISVDDTTGEVVFTPEHPRLGRRYRLRWTWTGYPSA